MKDIVKLENCRTELYQWDYNQKLILLNKEIDEVQFENKNYVRAIPAKVYSRGDEMICDIPQILLEQEDPITVFAYIREKDSGYTLVSQTLPIIGRKRPNNYYRQFLPKE